MGQRDGHDPSATLGRHLERPIQRLPGRVARIDEHERGPTDQVRVDGLAGDAATGRHLDPDRRRRPRPRPRPRRARPGARRSAISSIELACASCMSVVEVGSHMPRSPAAIDSSASIGRCQACARTSSPTRVTAAPSGNAAAKNRASNRRGIDGGVTQRDSGTSRSVRSRRSSASAIAGKAPGVREQPRPRADQVRTGVDVRQQHAHLLERLADRGDVGGQGRRPAPDPRRAAPPPPPPTGPTAPPDAGSASATSTRPPGNTCMSGANAIVAGRCVSRTSSPRGPGRTSTTVAAGRGVDRLRLGQGSLGAVPRARRRR